MRLVKPSFEIWEQNCSGDSEGIITSPETIHNSLLDGLVEHIERAGRTCYKSEDKITKGSASKFVSNMIMSKHYAMLEHGTLYLKIPYSECRDMEISEYDKYFNVTHSPYSRYVVSRDMISYITTNYRVLIENDALFMLRYASPYSEKFLRRVTVHFVCNRQVSHEFVRHRVFSFAQESTRYCNYSKDKFGSELSFIAPCWTSLPEGKYSVAEIDGKYKWTSNGNFIEDSIMNQAAIVCLSRFITAEDGYFKLIHEGWKPQQAATILPNSLKTELVMTGFVEDWKHFFDLRALGTTGAPHPQAKELAEPLMKEFQKRSYI